MLVVTFFFFKTVYITGKLLAERDLKGNFHMLDVNKRKLAVTN
jgi:hypothetical protein